MDNALLIHAVKLRAIDHRRQLPRGGPPRRDVLHLANFIDESSGPGGHTSDASPEVARAGVRRRTRVALAAFGRRIDRVRGGRRAGAAGGPVAAGPK